MKKLFSLLFLALAGAAPALAQWNTNATPKCLVSTTYVDENGETKTGGDYYACSPKVARTADKKTWMAWRTWGHKYINGQKTTAVRTYLQLLDRDGVAQFDEPILVNDHITPSWWSEYAICAAADGSAIVTVSDSRTEDESYVDEGYSPQTFTPAVYKIDQEGNFLWGLDGIEYRDVADGPYTNAFVIGDDTYFVYVRTGDDTAGTYIQRISDDGVEQWDEPLLWPGGSTLQLKMLATTDDEVLVFDTTPDGSRVHRMDKDLQEEVWGETVIYDEHKYDGYEMNHYRILSDGSGGAVVAFLRSMGIFSHNVRVQHINADGSLGFGLSGLDVYNSDEYDHNYPALAVNPKTEEIMVQFASQLSSTGNVMHQKFSFDGDYLYDELGVSIASKSTASNTFFYGLVGVGALECGDWVCCYRDISSYNKESFIIRRYDKDGKRVWTKTIGRDLAPANVAFVVEEEAAYLFYREEASAKEPGLKIFRIGADGTYNVTYPEPEPEVVKGDVNGDNTVDVADIASIISVMANSGTDATADVNGDGQVDVADIATVISIMAGE